jgi:hypothetical protein
MSGKLNEPGSLTIEWLDTEAETEYAVLSGPWVYADWLCWSPTESPNLTSYAPLRNIATWTKENDT